MARGKTCEELYIQNAENGIRAIKMRTKTPQVANVQLYLNKLKPVNIGMYDELHQKYQNVLKDYENNKRK